MSVVTVVSPVASTKDEEFLAMIKDAITYGVEVDMLDAALQFEDTPAQPNAVTLDARMRVAASQDDMQALDALVLESVVLGASYAA